VPRLITHSLALRNLKSKTVGDGFAQFAKRGVSGTIQKHSATFFIREKTNTSRDGGGGGDGVKWHACGVYRDMDYRGGNREKKCEKYILLLLK